MRGANRKPNSYAGVEGAPPFGAVLRVDVAGALGAVAGAKTLAVRRSAVPRACCANIAKRVNTLSAFNASPHDMNPTDRATCRWRPWHRWRTRDGLLALLMGAALSLPAQAQVSGAGGQPAKPLSAPERPAAALSEAAEAADYEAWQARFQTTYVRQNKPSFRAAYNGPNSLIPERERSYSLTATAMFGARPWRGAEIYFNPEMALGLPLSNLTGLGGFPNAELARTAGRTPTFYLARLFLRQTWDLGGDRQRVGSDQNQLAGSVPSRRIVATIGLLPVIDLFDDNTYNHDGPHPVHELVARHPRRIRFRGRRARLLARRRDRVGAR